jgi:hypothetical protein
LDETKSLFQNDAKVIDLNKKKHKKRGGILKTPPSSLYECLLDYQSKTRLDVIRLGYNLPPGFFWVKLQIVCAFISFYALFSIITCLIQI